MCRLPVLCEINESSKNRRDSVSPPFFAGMRRRKLISPLTFVGGETSSAEFTPPPQFPPSRRNLSFAENAGFCSSKLLRLVSPPTNVGGEDGDGGITSSYQLP